MTLRHSVFEFATYFFLLFPPPFFSIGVCAGGLTWTPVKGQSGFETLQYVAVCCRVLWCVEVCCSVLQCVAVCCSVLQYVAVCCSVLQCVAVCFSADDELQMPGWLCVIEHV